MGIALKLLIVDGTVNGMPYFSHTMLEIGGAPQVVETIKEIERQHGIDTPEDFYSYVAVVPDGSHKGGQCFGCIKETPYGKPVKYVLARHLKHLTFMGSERVIAAGAYINALSDNAPIALYWH